jgi:UDP-glucuronate 4-epimerase
MTSDVSGRCVLVTGAAGFIGMHVSRALLGSGASVVGADSFDPYYDVTLKEARAAQLVPHERFTLHRADLAQPDACAELFAAHRFDAVVHLAAQPGVRYSLVNPGAYVRNNLVAFGPLLEACRHAATGHLV